VQGKLFLGGLDLQSSKETVSAYCSKWCVFYGGWLPFKLAMQGMGGKVFC
jgi:hypothetical protein